MSNPKFLLCHVASQQPVKLTAVADFFEKVVEHSAASQISEQPFGREEILKGARNRLNCITEMPAISIETGLENHGEGKIADVTHCIFRTPLGDFYGSAEYILNENEMKFFSQWETLKDRQNITLGSIISPTSPNDWYGIEIINFKNASLRFANERITRKSIISKAIEIAVRQFSNWCAAQTATNFPITLKPHKGVQFIDIQSAIAAPDSNLISSVRQLGYGLMFNVVLILDARGFLFAGPFQEDGYRIIMARKSGKLPGEELVIEYEKEYGKDSLCIQKGLIQKGDRVLIVDDVIATGGTMLAAAKLVKMCEADVACFVAPFVVLQEGKFMYPPAISQNCRFLQTNESVGCNEQQLNPIDALMQKDKTFYTDPSAQMPKDTVCIFHKCFAYYGQTKGFKWGSFYASSNIWFNSAMLKNKRVLVFIDWTDHKAALDLLQLISILPKKKPKEVVIVMPFIDQSTQDRIEYQIQIENGMSITMESLAEIDTIAKLVGKNPSLTFDLHALQSQLVFENLTCLSIMTHLWKKFHNENPNVRPVFPDEGAKKRFTALLNITNALCFTKSRGPDGKQRILTLEEPIDEKTAKDGFVIIDDLVRSGGTLKKAREFLQKYTSDIYVMFSHAAFEPVAAKNLSGFKDVWTSDSCPRNAPREWVKVNVMDILAEYYNEY